MPTYSPEDEGSKTRYGGIGCRGGGSARDVSADDGPRGGGRGGRG